LEQILKDKPSLLVVTGVLVLALIFLIPSSGEIPEVPVDDQGYTETTVFVQNQNLQLRSDCWAIDMLIGAEQALSIQQGIRNELWERPGSHDIMIDALTGYDIDVVMVRIHSLRGSSYIADLFLQREDTVYRLDARPSDAVAVALRADAPIEVRESLLEEHGRNIC